MLDEGVWAELKVGDEHLRLFSEHNAQGVQVSVYDVRSKKWIVPSEPVEDIEQGKEKAAEYARIYLSRGTHFDLPTLIWKRVPVQTVDATPSGHSIWQYVSSEPILWGCSSPLPKQDAFSLLLGLR
jgi:hypothetical protein